MVVTLPFERVQLPRFTDKEMGREGTADTLRDKPLSICFISESVFLPMVS